MVRHINGLALEIKDYTEPIFHLGFNRSPMSTKLAQKDPSFVAQSTPPLEMACNVVSVLPGEAKNFPILPWLIPSWFIFLFYKFHLLRLFLRHKY